MNEESEELKARQAALVCLSYRPRSCKEISEKLRHKGYKEVIIQKVLKYLRSINYLNDQKFASDWADFLIRKKIVGKNYILQELNIKGIAGDIIDEVMQKNFSCDQEKKLCRQLLQKRIPRYERKKNVQYALFQLLRRHGFSQSIIWDILPEFIKNYNKKRRNKE